MTNCRIYDDMDYLSVEDWKEYLNEFVEMNIFKSSTNVNLDKVLNEVKFSPIINVVIFLTFSKSIFPCQVDTSIPIFVFSFL